MTVCDIGSSFKNSKLGLWADFFPKKEKKNGKNEAEEKYWRIENIRV